HLFVKMRGFSLFYPFLSHLILFFCFSKPYTAIFLSLFSKPYLQAVKGICGEISEFESISALARSPTC
ncbi:hypothetical protein, partial [Spirulina sp. 06S082]|uniref:hypothetical protein n=1 Tax=Spirulina sp. 06S082 TaxID=3110248 RepID=UPI002B1F0679